MSAVRVLRHLLATGWALRRIFNSETLQAIEQEIAEAERTHSGEIRFAVEANLSAAELLQGLTPRERALQAFAQMSVWDTEANNGVLIYLLWADHDVEIVADRGFNARVSAEQWTEICHRMETLFRQGEARRAVLEGVRATGALIAQHYPLTDLPSAGRDELPNRPLIL